MRQYAAGANRPLPIYGWPGTNWAWVCRCRCAARISYRKATSAGRELPTASPSGWTPAMPAPAIAAAAFAINSTSCLQAAAPSMMSPPLSRSPSTEPCRTLHCVRRATCPFAAARRNRATSCRRSCRRRCCTALTPNRTPGWGSFLWSVTWNWATTFSAAGPIFRIGKTPACGVRWSCGNSGSGQWAVKRWLPEALPLT